MNTARFAYRQPAPSRFANAMSYPYQPRGSGTQFPDYGGNLTSGKIVRRNGQPGLGFEPYNDQWSPESQVKVARGLEANLPTSSTQNQRAEEPKN